MLDSGHVIVKGAISLAACSLSDRLYVEEGPQSDRLHVEQAGCAAAGRRVIDRMCNRGRRVIDFTHSRGVIVKDRSKIGCDSGNLSRGGGGVPLNRSGNYLRRG